MKKLILMLFTSIILISECHAQTTITLQSLDTCFVYQPGSIEGKDARINSLEIYGGNQIELPVDAWTWFGEPGIDRSLIEFDLSNIPTNTEVLEATLNLYGAEDLPTGGHSTLSGSNEFIIQRVTSWWDEDAVLWATQPQTTSWNQVNIPPSQDPYQDYEIDVTELVQHMVTYPDSNFGFLMKLKTEEHYRKVNFASSDYTDDTKRPKLTVCFTYSVGQKELAEKKYEIKVYPNPTKDVINIEFPQEFSGVYKLGIYDINGRMVNTVEPDVLENSLIQQISVENLPDGVFIVLFEYYKGNYMSKFIKH